MTLKEKLAAGKPVFGSFMKSGSPAMVEIMGHTGFDYALLDMEHSPLPIDQLEHLIRAAEVSGMAPIVRVAGMSEADILHPLDKGAAGLLVPMVNTREEAERVVRLAKFAPLGARGMDIYSRAARYGFTPKAKHFESANRNTLLAVQIEGREGLKNVRAIADVEAVDVVFVGPYDLSQSLGLPGQVQDPRVKTEIRKLAEEIGARGKRAGIYVDDVETAIEYVNMGMRFIAFSVDVTIFMRACTSLFSRLRVEAGAVA